MQNLIPLLLMMKTGVLKLHPNNDGNTEVIVNTNEDFSLNFNSRNIPQSELTTGEFKVPIENIYSMI